MQRGLLHGGGGGIIAITFAITVAVYTIAIVAVIADVALLTLLCHRPQNGGGGGFLGTYPTYSCRKKLARPLVVCENKLLVIMIPLTGGRQMQNLLINLDEKGAKQNGGYYKHGRSFRYTGGCQRMLPAKKNLIQ